MAWTPISKAYVFASIGLGAPRPVGVVRQGDGRFEFAYAQSWLGWEGAFAIDPLNLPLVVGSASSRRLWGCLEDATPDNWGRKVLLATRSQQPSNDIEWLLATRGSGVGCLLFSASRSMLPELYQPPEFAELEELLRAAEALEQGLAPSDDALMRLLWHGSSMGGARPKITVSHEGREWIAKLGRHDDVFDQPRAEYASLRMAEAANVPVPEHRLIEIAGRSVLMIQRFDRSPTGKAHYLSTNALIKPDRVRDGDINSPVSYLRISEILRRISADAQADMEDLYRRMAFNVLIGNSDDHLKNHGCLRQKGGEYRLSPAFDLLPHPGQLAEQALVIGTQGRAANLSNVLSACERFGLQASGAQRVIDEVGEVVGRSRAYFQEAGMGEVECEILSNCCSRLLMSQARN